MTTNKASWKRNLALFLSGQGLTLFGSALVHFAIMWHITEQTKSGIMVAIITAAGTLPMFLAAPFAGVWADRYNKKLLINISDAAIAVITLALAVIFWQGHISMPLMISCLVLRSLGQGVQMPAVNALIPEIVPKEQLVRANTISGSIQSIVMLASPMAGGAMLAFAPIHTLMFVDVGTAIIGISLLFFFVKTNAVKKAAAASGMKQYVSELREGFKYVGKSGFLKKFMILTACFNILVIPIAVLTVLQVTRNYGHANMELFGFLTLNPTQQLASIEIVYSVGMMIGGVIMGIWGGFKNRSHTMAVSTLFLGLASAALGFIDFFPLYLGCMCFAGVIMNFFNPPMMATLQISVDPAYMGRLFSLLTMISSLVMPIGTFFWGPLADVFKIEYMLIITGIAILLMALVFVFDKSLLKAGALKDREDMGN